jgi:hypothetical protein
MANEGKDGGLTIVGNDPLHPRCWTRRKSSLKLHWVWRGWSGGGGGEGGVRAWVGGAQPVCLAPPSVGASEAPATYQK